MYRKIICIIMFTLLGMSLCQGAGMTIGGSNSSRTVINGRQLLQQDLEQQCTRQVRSTKTDTLSGIGCKLTNAAMTVTFMLNEEGIRELSDDRQAAENLEILAAEMKKNTCLNTKAFSSGTINRIIYSYTDPTMRPIFTFEVTKSDCGARAFRSN